ncbi:MAG TPA: CDP-alcohol phosphatidyltransferase family protein [Longimicrobiales bacterium]|nr:CDP-alcohol phosphatidyltransferase family protein [Longimicrobiales bacterium]
MTKRRADWLNLPNLISLTRVPMAFVFVAVESLVVRLALVVASGVSDWVDGRLARRSGTVTRAGELLDPIADRTFMVVAIVALVVEGALPGWAAPLILLRDIGVAVGGLAILILRPGTRLPARPAGKRVTWLQFVALVGIVIWPGLVIWVAPAIALLGLYALRDYGRAIAYRLRG